MAVTINASTTTGLVQSADLSGSLNVQSNGTTVLGVTSTGASVTGTQSVSGNLSFNSGYGSSAVAYGCRAWVNFNGTGTVAIRASGNVSSITDDGTGKYRVNFTNAMPDIDYAANISVSSMPAVSDSNFGIFNDNSGARGNPTTDAIRVSTFNAQFNYLDITYIYVSIFR
jgi:hypothetical protein